MSGNTRTHAASSQQNPTHPRDEDAGPRPAFPFESRKPVLRRRSLGPQRTGRATAEGHRSKAERAVQDLARDKSLLEGGGRPPVPAAVRAVCATWPFQRSQLENAALLSRSESPLRQTARKRHVPRRCSPAAFGLCQNDREAPESRFFTFEAMQRLSKPQRQMLKVGLLPSHRRTAPESPRRLFTRAALVSPDVGGARATTNMASEEIKRLPTIEEVIVIAKLRMRQH